MRIVPFLQLSVFSLGTFAAFSLATQAGTNIPGFRAVTATLFRGGRPRNEAEMQLLVQKGIHTIVNLQGDAMQILPGEKPQEIENARQMAEHFGLRFFHLPFVAGAKLDEDGQKMVLEVVRVMEDPQLQPVYVHCNVGADRTGVAVAAFRILHQNCSYDKARAELIENGQLWTPLLTASQMSFLRDLAADPARFSHPPSAAHCPL